MRGNSSTEPDVNIAYSWPALPWGGLINDETTPDATIPHGGVEVEMPGRGMDADADEHRLGPVGTSLLQVTLVLLPKNNPNWTRHMEGYGFELQCHEENLSHEFERPEFLFANDVEYHDDIQSDGDNEGKDIEGDSTTTTHIF